MVVGFGFIGHRLGFQFWQHLQINSNYLQNIFKFLKFTFNTIRTWNYEVYTHTHVCIYHCPTRPNILNAYLFIYLSVYIHIHIHINVSVWFSRWAFSM